MSTIKLVAVGIFAAPWLVGFASCAHDTPAPAVPLPTATVTEVVIPCPTEDSDCGVTPGPGWDYRNGAWHFVAPSN